MTREPIRWMRPLGRVAVAGAATAVLLAGCGGSDSRNDETRDGRQATPAGNSAVTVKQFQFMPAELTVNSGTNVTWTNQDDILHTATSGATPGTPDGKFDGQMDGRGKSFSHVFDQSGRYPYFCSRHTSMTGTVVVECSDLPVRTCPSGRAGGGSIGGCG